MAELDNQKYLALLMKKNEMLKELYDFTKINELTGDTDEADSYIMFINDRDRIFVNLSEIDEKLKKLEISNFTAEMTNALSDIAKTAKAILELDNKNKQAAESMMKQFEADMVEVAQNKRIKNYALNPSLSKGMAFDIKN